MRIKWTTQIWLDCLELGQVPRFGGGPRSGEFPGPKLVLEGKQQKWGNPTRGDPGETTR